MGTDSSGNSNNYTVNGTMTQNTDTPSNVNAQLNPKINNAGTISNANLTSHQMVIKQELYLQYH